MKKLIIGMLLLIPIIVILIVSLTASLVAGAYIAVENVDIYIKSADGKETLVDTEKPMIVYLSDQGVQLLAKVIPAHASNKEVEWAVIKNEPTIVVEGNKQLDVVTINSDGYVTFKNLGEASVQVTTKEGNVKKSIDFFVTSSDVMGITLSSTPELENISVGGRVVADVRINPSDAKIDQKYLNWEITSGMDKASVDENGIITALKEGKVTLKVSLKNPPEKLAEEDRWAEITFEIKPRDRATAFMSDKVVCTNSNSISLSQIVNNNTALAVASYSISENASIDDGKIQLKSSLGTKNCEVVEVIALDNLGNAVDKITIEFKQINVLNTDLWASITEEGNEYVLMKIGTAGIYLPIQTELTGNIQIVSTNENVVYYDDTKKCILAKGDGTAKISIKIGEVEESFLVKVVPAIYSLGLYFDASDDQVGIEMKRYFGKNTYNIDGTITNTIDFELRYIISTNGDKTIILNDISEIKNYLKYVDYSIDNAATENGYSISGNGILTTVDKGDKVTVTAKAKYPIYESVDVKAEYNCNFISNGVNVGLPTKADREKEGFDMNAFTINGFTAVNNAVKADYDAKGNNTDYAQKYSIIVQESMVFAGQTNPVYTSIYGNGEYLRQVAEDSSSLGTGLGADNMPHSLLKIVVDDVLIQNVTIRASRALRGEESMFDYSKAGNGILIDGREHYFPGGEEKIGRLKNIQIKYTTVENAYYCVFIAAADVVLEGTLMRNSGQQTLYINTSVKNEGTSIMNCDVTLKNTVFTNSINMSIGIIPFDLDDSYDVKVYDAVTGKKVPKYILYFREVTDSEVKFDGFCHIYNWKTGSELDFSYLKQYFIEDLNNVKKSEKEKYENMVSLLKTALSGNVDKLLDNMGWGDMRKKVDGVNYFQLAVGRIGVHYPMSSKIREGDLDKVGLKGEAMMDLSKVAGSFGGQDFASKISYPLYFYCYDSANPVIGPKDVCVPNAKLYEKLVNGI